MLKIAVFASGRGTNFSALVRAAKKGAFKKARITLLVCDRPKAAVLQKAKRAGVKAVLVQRGDFADKSAFEAEIIRRLEEHGIDLVVMAGFMRILSPGFVRRYQQKIINIHPALLPAFKGAHAIKDAFDAGVKVTGVTVHFVDELMDHGPAILQEEVSIKKGDTLESLEARIHKVEHRIYPEAVRLFVEGRLRMEEGKVKIVSSPAASPR